MLRIDVILLVEVSERSSQHVEKTSFLLGAKVIADSMQLFFSNTTRKLELIYLCYLGKLPWDNSHVSQWQFSAYSQNCPQLQVFTVLLTTIERDLVC